VLNNPTEIIVSPFVLKNLTKIKTMSAVIGKLVNPASYKQQWLKTCSRAYARYHPTTRDNSATLLFHSMIGISVVMYTGTYISRVYPEVQKKRAIKRVAMAEYNQKHGVGDHH